LSKIEPLAITPKKRIQVFLQLLVSADADRERVLPRYTPHAIYTRKMIYLYNHAFVYCRLWLEYCHSEPILLGFYAPFDRAKPLHLTTR
jgi:hypothetical protein